MSVIHRVKCDICGATDALKYNSEHWLAPLGWVQLYDDNNAQMLDEHICPKCRPKKKKSEKVGEK